MTVLSKVVCVRRISLWLTCPLNIHPRRVYKSSDESCASSYLATSLFNALQKCKIVFLYLIRYSGNSSSIFIIILNSKRPITVEL